MTEFWELPGPASFVRRLAEDLRAGSNVVVLLPEHSPEGWLPALRGALCDTLPRLEQVDHDGRPPLTALHRHLGLHAASPHAHLSDLCENSAFRCRLLHVSPRSDETSRAWRQFLTSYEDACRVWPLAERTLFVTELVGLASQESPSPANLLRVHRWNACLDSLDIRLFVAGLCSNLATPIWQRNLAVTLLAELALWDPHVCMVGASLPLSELLAPSNWLADIARSRGWSASDDPQQPDAEFRGIRHVFDGSSRVHSAWLALAGRMDALAYRIWNAQITSLFPLLERHRRALIKTYAPMGLLRVPYVTTFSTIQRVEDLELSHIAEQMSHLNSHGMRDICNFVCWLRDLRNDLAHLSPIPVRRLTETQFLARLGNLDATEAI